MSHDLPRGAEGWPLVVACARHAAGIGDASAVRAAAQAVRDTARALQVVRRHRLIPWLARSLRDSGAPAALLAGVHAEAQLEAGRTLAQVRLLARLCRAFAAADVPALPYKGPLLSLQLYGDLALRSSTDLDIVVPRRCYQQARAALVSEGFPPRSGLSARQERALFGGLGQASFGKGADDFVELHWRFAPRQFAFPLDPEEALRRGTMVTVAGTSMVQMEAADLLATLAMHGARHLFEQLEWLAGVVRAFHAVDDVDAMLSRAAELHVRRMVLVSAALAGELLGAELDARWLSAVRADPGSVAAAAEIASAVRAEALQDGTLPEDAALQSLYGRMTDTTADRVRLLALGVLLPTEREWEAMPLPEVLTPLYGLVRAGRLAQKYARRAAEKALA